MCGCCSWYKSTISRSCVFFLVLIIMFTSISILFLMLDWCEPATNQLQTRIVNGKLANIDEYPFMVSICMGGAHICGGSIITRDTVLSAAHCLPLERWVIMGTTTVKVGESVSIDFDENQTQFAISNYYTHENYTKVGFGYDVAILKIQKEFSFGKKIKPISFAQKGFIIKPGKTALIMGWGHTHQIKKTKAGGRFASGSQLRYASVPIIANEKCQGIFANKEKILDSQICAHAGERAIDTCQGDSGGPLIVDGVLVGIVSWGYGCADPKYPGVYTRVSSFSDWIESHL